MPCRPSILRLPGRILALLCCQLSVLGALTLDNEKATYATLTSTPVVMTGKSELVVTGSGDPIPGCTIDLNSEDSWVFFPAVVPTTTVSTLLSRIRVNGATAVADTNVRVVEYVSGSVVIPQPSTYRPLQVFTGRHLTGFSTKLSPYTAYGNAALGSYADNIRSFVLKRGYTATFAVNENGTGTSVNYVAQDGDLEVSVLPAALEGTISFVRIFPWRWTGKKGSCDVDPTALNANWHYDWNIDKNSTRNWEYVAIRQQRYWPGLGQDWQARGVNHLSGYNEPNNSAEDAYTTLDNGSTATAVAAWPDLLATGLRVGAPAVTDGGYSWITDFMTKANAANARVDYVPIHYYRSYSNAADPAGATTQMYNFLKSVHDAVGKPIWVTEFNNGANWTTDPDPTVDQNKATVEAMVNMMDATPWIERYAVYSRVEWFRQTHYDDGSITPMGAMYRDHAAPIAYQQAIPNSGTSANALYAFDGNTRDSLSGNNPVVYGTPKTVAGKYGSALSFDGTDDYLALPGKLGDSDDFSFAGWIKWNGGSQWQRVFDLGNGTNNYMFLSPLSGGNTLRFAIKYNGGTEQQLNTSSLTPGVWTHVAVTISGNTGKLFVNGTLAATNTAMTYNPSQLGTETNYLGKSQFADPLFSGTLDDVRFVSTALTDAQVTALAGSATPQFAASPTGGTAVIDQPFSGGLASQITSGGTVTFSKVSGPAWIAVAPDGSLSGIPRLADAGANSVLVRATAIGGASTTATIPILVAAPEPLVRYAFNGNALATAGTANGTAVNGPTYPTGVNGQAIDLDGTDDHVVLPAHIVSADEITIATWVQWDGGSNWQRLFDFGNDTNNYLFLTPKSGSGTLRFAIKFNGGTEQTVETTGLTVGTWTHVALTLGGGAAKLYVNGSLAAANAAVTIKPSDIRPVVNYLGRSQFAADPYFNGRLDDFEIFHRALAATEIAALKAATAPAFTTNPLTLAAATAGTSYETSLALRATVPTGTITWSKVGGPAWLNVEADGRISGIPGPGDSGNLPFRIRASSGGLASDLDLILPVQPPANLRVHLELNGTATDSAGTNHATANGAPTYVSGLFDKAIDLNGTADYLQLPAAAGTGLTDCTFSVRFRWDGGTGWQRLFDFGNNTSQYFFLTPSSPGGMMRFTITTNGNAGEQYIETTAPPTGEWTHAAVVLSGTTATLYVNGAAAATGTITLHPTDIAPTLLYLGKSQWPADPYYNGAIDDFQLFSRALTATEVKALAVPAAPASVPRGYASWSAAIAFPTGQDQPASDPDGDGQPNLVEWLTGTPPLSPATGPVLTSKRFTAAELSLAGTKTYMGISARLRKVRPGIVLIPEGAATPQDLGTPASAAHMLSTGPATSDGDFEVLKWYYDIPLENGGTGFVRLRMQKP